MSNNKHTFNPIVEGEPRYYRIDFRLNQDHVNLRTNVTIHGKSTNIIKRDDGIRILQGTQYSDIGKCCTCNKSFPKKKFENMAIMKKNRKHNGFNIHCRDCQSIKYTKKSGYKIDEGFLVDDDEETGFYSDSGEESEFDEGEEESDEEESEEEEGEEEERDEEESEEEESEDFEVENIISHKYNKKTGTWLFQVKWLGYDDCKNTFEPAESLKHLIVFRNYIIDNNNGKK